jgi:hypothetical protein
MVPRLGLWATETRLSQDRSLLYLAMPTLQMNPSSMERPLLLSRSTNPLALSSLLLAYLSTLNVVIPLISLLFVS